jgi:hypothetical protein
LTPLNQPPPGYAAKMETLQLPGRRCSITSDSSGKEKSILLYAAINAMVNQCSVCVCSAHYNQTLIFTAYWKSGTKHELTNNL